GGRQRAGTSMARPRCRLQCLMETSPGRRRVLSVGPRIPSFSNSGARRPVSASLNTRFRRLLCLEKQIHGLLAKRARGRGREHGLAEETGNGNAEDFGGQDGIFSIKARRASREPGVSVRGVKTAKTLGISGIG